jgi:hypothetical protein
MPWNEVRSINGKKCIVVHKGDKPADVPTLADIKARKKNKSKHHDTKMPEYTRMGEVQERTVQIVNPRRRSTRLSPTYTDRPDYPDEHPGDEDSTFLGPSIRRPSRAESKFLGNSGTHPDYAEAMASGRSRTNSRYADNVVSGRPGTNTSYAERAYSRHSDVKSEGTHRGPFPTRPEDVRSGPPGSRTQLGGKDTRTFMHTS